MSKVPTYWVSWTEGGGKFSRDFEGGYGPGEDDVARAKARAFLEERLADPAASGVRLERHEPSPYTDRPAITTLYPAPSAPED